MIVNPEVGPLRHKVGLRKSFPYRLQYEWLICNLYVFPKVGRAPAGTKDIVTVTAIHPAFGNIHRTGYYRRKLLVEAGVIPEKKIPGAADSFILDMEHWAQ